VAARERNENAKLGREREGWKRVLEWEQGLKRGGRERIIERALGTRKPVKESWI